MQYATGKYNQNEQNQWTCDSIVSEIENARNSSEYIGNQVNQIIQTTGQSTIQKPTTITQEKNTNTTHHIRNAETGTTTT